MSGFDERCDKLLENLRNLRFVCVFLDLADNRRPHNDTISVTRNFGSLLRCGDSKADANRDVGQGFDFGNLGPNRRRRGRVSSGHAGSRESINESL